MAKFSSLKFGDRNGFSFQCPGCGTAHMVLTDNGSPCWKFNGDIDNPTVAPSIKVRAGNDIDGRTICHSFIEKGKIRFLNNCTHKLPGQTVDLPDWE